MGLFSLKFYGGLCKTKDIEQGIFSIFGKTKFIFARVTFLLFKVIQGHWYWHQLKARMDFLLVCHSIIGSISLALLVCYGDTGIAGLLCS